MQTEILAVVDETDNVIDQRPRHEIHQQGLRHRAVHILVFNRQSALLLQKRSMRKDLNKGLWDTSAAGHVDLGEDYDHSAVRETEEELGINVAGDLQRLFKLNPVPELGMEFVQVYRCVHEGPFDPAPDEIDQLQWFTVKEITQRVEMNGPDITETFKSIWQTYQKLA